MSASLVGSEMCIRDRQGVVRHASGFAASCPLACSVRSRVCRQSASTSACLLYTSDAADDM
eukprot:1888822-Alexandrium_andersonii.AAC.1